MNFVTPTCSTPLMFPDEQLWWDITGFTADHGLVEFNKINSFLTHCVLGEACKCCTMVDEWADTQSHVCNLT